MICKPELRERLASLVIMLTFCGFAHAQNGRTLAQVVPDLQPSAVISDGAPSFHLSSSADSLTNFDTTTSSEGNNQEGIVTRALKRGLEDQKELWSAPFHKQNLKWDALFLAGTGTLVAFDEQILHALPETQVKTSGNVSNALIVSEGVALGSIFFIKGLHGGDSHAKETGFIGLEALANTFIIYAPLQVIAGRQRPNEGSGEGNFFTNHSVNTSFPGGHSMFAFSMATVIAHEYPRWWVQLLSYGAAGAITGARMTAKDHFPSDLLVGGALGYLIGTHVFHSRCDPDLGGDCHSRDKAGP